MVFMNETGKFAIIYNGLTTNITGSESTTLLIILAVMLALFFSFNFKVEWALIFMFPMFLISMAYMSVIGTFIFFVIFILALVIRENFI